jgi:hypothetical protein
MKSLCQHLQVQVSGQMRTECIGVWAVFTLGIEVEIPQRNAMKRGIVAESPTEGNVSESEKLVITATFGCVKQVACNRSQKVTLKLVILNLKPGTN